jgi:hypothetical protein
MSDPYVQRELERAREDADDARRRQQERADRAADHAPALPPACKACGARAGVYDVGGGPACAWCGAPA